MIRSLPNSYLEIASCSYFSDIYEMLYNFLITCIPNLKILIFFYQNSPVINIWWQQFVDLCGTIHDLTRAWNLRIRLFPHTLRTASSKHAITDGKALKLQAKEVREETFDPSSGLLIQLPLEDDKMSPTKNPDTQAPTNVSEERLQ